MKKKIYNIKNKIVNHIMIDGKKKTSEKLFLKSFKQLQTNSKKQTKKFFQLCLINATPIFKLHQSSNKKVKKKKRKIRIMPVFINSMFNRLSLGIKFIIKNIRKKKSNTYFYSKLTQEILLLSENKGFISDITKENCKKILLNKRYTKHYRW
jgi:ribosomal protein S7